ncbi:hypothetical protein Acr_00g0044830 [Actinidia rufa]|uniref:Uncharacterized protein n=1 Tax=Actinidia rufa TaxID=165716 RepID=A0A7J0DKT3_9ERIC|nr:hypothetical protein Acr_00g0044830 [Actinidia rufa]
MSAKVTQLPWKDPPSPEGSPSVDTRPPFDRETNTMTQGELNRLRESCSFSVETQIRLPEVDETIMSTRSGEVAFYEASFQASLRLSIHPTIRRILYYYNICHTQLVSNAWRSVICVVVLWQFHKFSLFLNEFRNLFGLFKNLKSDSKWLYFKARSKKTLLGGKSLTLGPFSRALLLTLDKWRLAMGDNAKDKPTGGAIHVVSNEGKSHHSRDDPPQGDHSRDDSMEYIGTIRKEIRKVLHRLPDLTLSTTVTRAQIGRYCLHSSLSISSRLLVDFVSFFEAMSRKIDLKKLAQMVKGTTSAAKGMVIGEKHSRDETLDMSPSKKGKQATDAKKKGLMLPPEKKKKGPAAKAPSRSKATSKVVVLATVPREGTSANLGVDLGPNTSVMENSEVVEKLL